MDDSAEPPDELNPNPEADLPAGKPDRPVTLELGLLGIVVVVLGAFKIVIREKLGD